MTPPAGVSAVAAVVESQSPEMNATTESADTVRDTTCAVPIVVTPAMLPIPPSPLSSKAYRPHVPPVAPALVRSTETVTLPVEDTVVVADEIQSASADDKPSAGSVQDPVDPAVVLVSHAVTKLFPKLADASPVAMTRIRSPLCAPANVTVFGVVVVFHTVSWTSATVGPGGV